MVKNPKPHLLNDKIPKNEKQGISSQLHSKKPGMNSRLIEQAVKVKSARYKVQSTALLPVSPEIIAIFSLDGQDKAAKSYKDYSNQFNTCIISSAKNLKDFFEKNILEN
ncbi:hypothetical protein [Treponema bryantii]|uniref:hypothetical protein n=1 Tax=Treponema bryantii TaxID=163 RepID=UPI002B3054F1|nr:hypothetical protein TRBR_05420 [Treponema bryantii]